MRGGGGNFGVATSFEFRGCPVRNGRRPTLYPMEIAGDVLRWWDELMASASDDLYGFYAFLTVPPGPRLPEELHMQKMCGVVWGWTGPVEEAEEALAPVRARRPPCTGARRRGSATGTTTTGSSRSSAATTPANLFRVNQNIAP